MPSTWKYTPYPNGKSRFKNPLYHNPYHVPTNEKSNVGPGYYYDNSEKAITNQVLRSSSSFQFSKCKLTNFAVQKALQTKYVPPVGTYKGAEKYNTITHIIEKKSRPISKYKFERFTEAASKSMAWVPGPGAYNIDRKPRVPIKASKD